VIEDVRETLSADDLRAAGLDHLFEAIEAGVDPETGRNVAVVAEPYAGRDLLLDHVESQWSAVGRTSFDAVVEESPEFGDHDAILVDDCHYCYTREVGGFGVLDEFLDRAAVSDAPFVTSWNRYAWEYLSPVRDVDELFAKVIEVPPLDPEGVADLLLANYADRMPTFVETDDAGSVKTVGVDPREVAIPGGGTVTVPVPELNAEYLTSWSLSRSERVADTQAVVFQKIARVANGNPGVATAVWERSRAGEEVAPADVPDPDTGVAMDDEKAFVLEVLLAKERLPLSRLASILDQLPVERLVQSLAEQGHVVVADGTVSIDPQSLHAIVDHLQGRRLVW